MKMKKIIALLLALVMVFALVACGGTGDDTTKGGNDTSKGGSDTSKNDDTSKGDDGQKANYTKTKDGMPVVSIMLISNYGNEMTDARDTDGAVQKAIEDYTGVSPEWNFVNAEGYGDIMNMTLLDPANMPMILSFSGNISTTIIQAAQNGAFWDIGPYLDSGDYPNLATMSDGIRDIFTVNGGVIAIPKMRSLGRYGLSYRGDWAEKLGFTEPPKTVDDVYELLKAFRENDPDGNGQKDTYGLEVNGSYLGWMDVIFTWFGCGVGWVEQDGNLVPIHETAEFKEACDWIRKLTAEDIIRPDWPSVGTDGWGEAMQKGQAGAFVDTLDSGGRRAWRYYIGDANIPSVTGTSPDPEHPTNAWVQMVGAINGHTACTQVYNGGFLITKAAAKTEDDVKACLAFLDKMNDKAMRALADFGIEGVTYHIDENGYAVSDIGGDANLLPSQGINQAQAMLPYILEDSVKAKDDAAGTACTAAMLVAQEAAVVDVAAAYELQSPTYVSENTNIAQSLNDAKVRYCAGVDTWEQFQAAVAEWEQRGGAAIKQEINDLYHANQG